MTETTTDTSASAPAVATHREERLRARLFDRLAQLLAARGCDRIALYGAGRHSRPLLRQPWSQHGIRVEALLDDGRERGAPPGSVEGVRVIHPGDLADELASNPGGWAVVLSSEAHEPAMAARAAEIFGPIGVPVERVYWLDESSDGQIRERLERTGAVPPEWIDWLVRNRGERHDATLPMLPPDRTELHVRRYELAAQLLRNSAAGGVVGDLASGTGYGSHILAARLGARAIGGELDPEAVRYASDRFGAPAVSFRCVDARETGLEAGSLDGIASFETVEHVEDAAGLTQEFARLLKPGGTLVISTPNQMGPTPYHVHDFDMDSFATLLSSRFEIDHWIGQCPGDRVLTDDLPAGMFPLEPERALAGDWSPSPERAEFLIAVARPLSARG